MENKEVAAVMYWCEGSKVHTKKNGWKQYRVEFSNTDPLLLKLFINGLRSFKIDEEKLRVRLFLYETVDESKVIEYWSNWLNIPKNQFTRPIRRKTPDKIKHLTGIVNLRYNSKELYLRIQEEIDKLKEKYG